MAKLIVYIAGLGFLGFGIAALIDPERLLAGMGLQVGGSGSLTTELRAFYGGLELGLGGLTILLALRDRLTDALGLTLVAYGSLAAGRLIGILVAGDVNTMIWVALAIEVIVASLAGWQMLAGRRA
ncbi:MAG: DUF4345 family protein [Xanthomonadales bacterium]|nr:DUF4345 family protein [Xanthomonadales bacterium]